MKRIILFLILIAPINVFAATPMQILKECRPNADSVTGFDPRDKSTIKQTYYGADFPSDAEWGACGVAASKTIARNSKLDALNAKGIEHICRTSGLCYESWNELVIAFHDWSSMAPAARQATASKSKAINHYQPWLDAKTTLNNYTGLNSIAFFNVSTMVSWP
jgi:hypothetical protein